jgi:hypothetical protein
MKRFSFFGFAALVVACGSSTDNKDGGSDAATNDATDAAIVGCDLVAPFGAAVAIAELNTSASESDPRLTHDELTMYFTRISGSTADDIWVATRSSKTAPFGAPTKLAIDTTGSENTATVTGDDLTLYFTTSRSTPGPAIFMATRPSTSVDFGTATNVSSINVSSTGSYRSPYVMPDGLGLYFDSDVGATAGGPCGGSCTDIFRATATTPGSFTLDTGAFVNVNTSDVETNAVVTIDELTLYFYSDHAGVPHVWRATRASKSAPFGTPSPSFELDSTLTLPGWISDDGCRLYISKEITSNNLDLYVASKPAK